MSIQKATTPSFQVSVKVSYAADESQPERGYYLFSYKVSITNTGNSSAQLLSRHWTITDAEGKKEEVRGPGVVGIQPKIQAGQTFEYESACPLVTTTGSMKGRYFFIAENGESFSVDVPEFYLISPTALH